MKILISGMSSWHMNKTASALEKLDALESMWTGNKNQGLPSGKYKRIWPYHLAMKPFYHFSSANLEEKMRWRFLWLYDAWIKRQVLPKGVNIVQCPMGSCTPVFDLAENSGRRILKVFEAMNGHPTTQRGYWQREADIHYPGFVIPVGEKTWGRMNREIYRADYVLCPSTYVMESMVANGVPPEKCILNHFGVDTSLFSRRNEEDISPTPKFIVTGSLTVRKGHQYLFQAFSKLQEEYPDAELHSFGSPRPDFKKVLRQWEGFPHLHLNRNVPQKELVQHLKTCTAFVFPSLEEGFARSLLEAMAIGLPIIATHESGATTILDRESAMIVPGANTDAIYQAMKALCKNKELVRHYGEKAWEKGGQRNTWDDYASRLMTAYEARL